MVICLINDSTHYVVLTGISEDGSRFYVNNPNGRIYNSKKEREYFENGYPIDKFEGGMIYTIDPNQEVDLSRFEIEFETEMESEIVVPENKTETPTSEQKQPIVPENKTKWNEIGNSAIKNTHKYALPGIIISGLTLLSSKIINKKKRKQ